MVDDDITDPEDKTKINEEVGEMAKALNDLKEDAAKEKKRYYAQVVSFTFWSYEKEYCSFSEFSY